MEKELKSNTGVLLRADLTGHIQFSQSANFCQKISTTFLAPHIKKLETYFALIYFWIFAQCAQQLQLKNPPHSRTRYIRAHGTTSHNMALLQS